MAVTSKVRKKNWYQILASQHFNGKLIGETLAYEANDLIGRPVCVSMMNLTGDIKKQNINVTFIIEGVKDNKALTYIKKIEMTPSSVRRLVRKGKEKIDMSFVVETADKKLLRIKPLYFTIAKTGGSKLASLRKNCENYIAFAASRTNHSDFLKDIITYKLQKETKSRLNKIYPIKLFEIRSVELLKEGSAKPVKFMPIEEIKAPEKEKEIVEELKEKIEQEAKEEAKTAAEKSKKSKKEQ